MSSFYSIADRLLDVQALDTSSSKVISEFIARYYFARVSGQTAGEADCAIKIATGYSLPAMPSGTLAFKIANGHCYVYGETSYLQVDDSVVIIRPRSARTIEILIGDTTHARQPSAINNVLSYGFQAALRRCALFELHAAGVVEPERGQGALLIGGSGSGKSTLTLRLAGSGWQYLSDDVLALTERAGRIEAQALRRIFALTDSTVRAFDMQHLEQALDAQSSINPGKRILQPNLLFPDSFSLSSIPSVLFFPSIATKKESRVVRLSQTDAMTKLVKLSLWTPYDSSVARLHFTLLGKLVRQTVAYDLVAGTDILEDPQRASTLLGPLMEK